MCVCVWVYVLGYDIECVSNYGLWLKISWFLRFLLPGFRFSCVCRRHSIGIYLHGDFREQASMTPPPTPSTQAASLCTEPMLSIATKNERRGWGVSMSSVGLHMTSMGFSIHGHRFSQVVYSLFLLRCFRRESCFKQTVKQNNKIPSLEKIQYNSKNTKFKEKFTTKDILSATSMPQPLHREAQVTDSSWSFSHFISTVLGPWVGSLWRVEPGLDFRSPSSKTLLYSIVPQGPLPNLNYQYVFLLMTINFIF